MKRILVIEDNPDNLKLVEMLLGPLQVSLRMATDGPSGIQAAQEETFDLILLDIQLPGMDGYAVAKALRAISRLAATPIVAVTSYAMAGDREKALLEGFTEYLEKPLDPGTFAHTIGTFI
jgi:two-component system, cell cycle response regulator DivK